MIRNQYSQSRTTQELLYFGVIIHPFIRLAGYADEENCTRDMYEYNKISVPFFLRTNLV